MSSENFSGTRMCTRTRDGENHPNTPLRLPPNDKGYRVYGRGLGWPTDGSLTVVTGLTTVDVAVCSFDGDPVVTCMFAHADKGDQAGAPAAGSILIVTTKPTDTAGSDSDIAPIAATTPFVDVNWVAMGDE